MKRKQDLWIILFVVMILAIYTIYEVNKPQPIDWSTNFSIGKKSPYGTYIMKEALPLMFPDGKVEISRSHVQERLRLRRDVTPEVYFFVDTYFGFSRDELDALLDHVKEGNTLFVSAEFIQDTLLTVAGAVSMESLMRGSSYLRHAEGEPYLFPGRLWYFDVGPSFRGDVLGYVNNGNQPDFIRVTHGKGVIYLHANPKAFTNFHVLDSASGDYYQRALSFLPPGLNVAWDEYQKIARASEHTPLRVMLQYPALRWSYYLLLIGGLLFVLFRSKREQRAIPVIRPPENRTLEFVSVVSSLYYKQRDHKAIANKRIDYFLEGVRYYYKMRTDELDGDFVRLLSGRSGVSEGEVLKLVEWIHAIRKMERVDERALRELVRCIEWFKKNK